MILRKWYALAFLALLTACSSSDKAIYKSVFRYNEAAGISSLDPAFARNMENMWAVNQVYEGLVELDNDLNIQPALAKSWQVSQDGLTYQFTIDTSIYFHKDSCFKDVETRHITAKDVAFSFNRILDKKMASPGRWVFDKLDLAKGKHGVEVLNDTLVSIYLKEAYSPFLNILTMPYATIAPQEAVAFYGDDFSRHPVGTGPYRFFMWSDNVKLIFHKNENYRMRWENNQAPEAIAISFVKDKGAAFLELLKGNLDMISGIDGGWKDEMLNAKGQLLPEYATNFYLQKVPYLKTDYLGFQLDTAVLSQSPWNNKLVRQAINSAINKQHIVTYLRSGIGSPAQASFTPPSLLKKQPKGEQLKGGQKGNYNLEKAQALLLEAGYPNGKGLPMLVISTTSAYVDMCEYIQNQLTKIGVVSTVDVLPSSNHRSLVAGGQLRFFRKSWIADYPSSDNFLGLFHAKNKAPNGPNYTRFENAEFDAFLDSALVVTNPEKQHMFYEKADSVVMEEMPVIPLFYDEVVRVVNKHVKTFPVNSMNMLKVRDIQLN